MAAFPDDWSGGLANGAAAVEVLGAGEAIRVRRPDGTTCVLRAADVRPTPGQDARAAVGEAIRLACLAQHRARA
jgi:hypothetical protein